MKRRWLLQAIVALALLEMGPPAMGADERVLDAVDKLVESRGTSNADLDRLLHLMLAEQGSTEYFEIRVGDFPPRSPFSHIEVRKARDPNRRKGLIVLDIKTEPCVPARAVVDRYGAPGDIAPPLAGGPPDRPTDWSYPRPWGKLSFGIVTTADGECLSRAVIDWAK